MPTTPSSDFRPGDQDTMLMPSVVPTVGTVIDGRYRLDALLGEGGMGAVYRGIHLLMGKPVAVKLIHGELANNPEAAARFEREARSASLLKDPHCISVTDFGKTEGGVLYLVMELLEGEDLATRLARTGALPTEKALRIVKEVCGALSHAHCAGVVHRDLKPDNIMLVRHGDAEDFTKVIDFGIARIADSADMRGDQHNIDGARSSDASQSSGSNKLTRVGFVLGTPAYLSPEQARGKEADHRADLYSLGVVLYEALAGKQPFAGETAMDVVMHHLTTPVPRLPRQRYTPELQSILDKAMAKGPAERYQTAAEFAEAIDALPPWALVASPSWLEKVIPPRYENRLRLVATSLIHRYRLLPHRVQKIALASLGAVGLALGLMLTFALFGPEAEPSGEQAQPGTLVVVDAQGADEKRLKALLQFADTQLRSGLAQEAAITAQEILDKSPSQWSALLLLGHARFALGERALALEAYSRAISALPSLAADIRLGEYLDEALSDDCCREQAVKLLVDVGGKKGLERVIDKASSPLAPSSTRKACRDALIAAGMEDQIDWLTSLSSDLEQAKTCAERKEIIAAIAERNDPRFLPLLQSKIPPTPKRRFGWRRKFAPGYSCVAKDLDALISSLREQAQQSVTP
jgi:serine/threonine protein kinase